MIAGKRRLRSVRIALGRKNVNLISPGGVRAMKGGYLVSPKMTTTETCHYRGYDIVPTRLWSSWCVGVYRTRADIPLMAQSTLNTFAPRMEEAVDEAKQSIDRALDNRRPEKGNWCPNCELFPQKVRPG
jgi:hypothetical protein